MLLLFLTSKLKCVARMKHGVYFGVYRRFRGRLLLLRVAGALAVALILSLITSACRYVYRKRLKTKLRETQWTDTTDTDDDHDSVDTTPSVEHGPVPPSSLRRKRTEAPAPTMKRQKKLS